MRMNAVAILLSVIAVLCSNCSDHKSACEEHSLFCYPSDQWRAQSSKMTTAEVFRATKIAYATFRPIPREITIIFAERGSEARKLLTTYERNTKNPDKVMISDVKLYMTNTSASRIQ